MSFAFELTPGAERELTDIWLRAVDRNSVTSASDAIESRLSRDPFQGTEFLFDTVRRLILAPLGVDFEVNESERHIIVLAYWDSTIGPPSPTGD
jgi:hypothetical protein